MTDKVEYKTAIDFARHFYGTLGRGNSMATAIEQGKVGASIASTGHENIKLMTAPGVVAEEIVLYRARA